MEESIFSGRMSSAFSWERTGTLSAAVSIWAMLVAWLLDPLNGSSTSNKKDHRPDRDLDARWPSTFSSRWQKKRHTRLISIQSLYSKWTHIGLEHSFHITHRTCKTFKHFILLNRKKCRLDWQWWTHHGITSLFIVCIRVSKLRILFNMFSCGDWLEQVRNRLKITSVFCSLC